MALLRRTFAIKDIKDRFPELTFNDGLRRFPSSAEIQLESRGKEKPLKATSGGKLSLRFSVDGRRRVDSLESTEMSTSLHFDKGCIPPGCFKSVRVDVVGLRGAKFNDAEKVDFCLSSLEGFFPTTTSNHCTPVARYTKCVP